VVAALVFVGSALQSLRERCHVGDVGEAIVVDVAPQLARYDRGKALSAIGVFGVIGSASDAVKLSERQRSRVDSRPRACGESGRWRVQSEDFGRRCKQQVEKF
jgi:hypothetical protein